tara:strand:- start:3921 stop:4481 length:561 start_codon:yes stop_codon:yes gene_type:complete
MLFPLDNKYTGLLTISGPSKSGKSKLAEFLIKNQDSVTYIATSKPRHEDPEWQRRVKVHKKRRPNSWKVIEYPLDICKYIESMSRHESILIDSLGGLVEQYLMLNNKKWEVFQNSLIDCLRTNDYSVIVIVVEEISWGIVPSTPIGHLYRERLCHLAALINIYSSRKWLAVQGNAIDLDKIGFRIP